MGKRAQLRRQRKKLPAAERAVASQRRARTPSASPGQLAGDLVALERFDGHAGLRNALRVIAQRDREWAGIPMPMEGEHLVVEPSYPHAEVLSTIGAPRRSDSHADDDYAGAKIRNRWYCMERGGEIVVWEHRGKVLWGLEPHIHHFDLDLRTLGCSDAWGVEQESNAVNTLAELVSHRQLKHYMLTGMFLEKSPRSHVTYMFRRLKPTVAMHAVREQMRILCALCMHPIAYYAGSWAGAMCPTDDVIAHLMLMRADEHMFWKRCNQHPSWRKEAGL
jgi:hypothetical protein